MRKFSLHTAPAIAPRRGRFRSLSKRTIRSSRRLQTRQATDSAVRTVARQVPVNLISRCPIKDEIRRGPRSMSRGRGADAQQSLPGEDSISLAHRQTSVTNHKVITDKRLPQQQSHRYAFHAESFQQDPGAHNTYCAGDEPGLDTKPCRLIAVVTTLLASHGAERTSNKISQRSMATSGVIRFRVQCRRIKEPLNQSAPPAARQKPAEEKRAPVRTAHLLFAAAGLETGNFRPYRRSESPITWRTALIRRSRCREHGDRDGPG